ncbi:MAG: IS3 family transposase [Bacteroidota bacterium]
MNFTLEQYYKVLGISRQAFHKWRQGFIDKEENLNRVMYIIMQVRMDHPGMGIRKIWKFMQPPISRDSFERLAKSEGLYIQPPRNKFKTTNSRGVCWVQNRIKNLDINRPNQVWVSDITYYRIKESFHYITLIMDLFSRRIIGYNTSKTLQTIDTTLPALEYALKIRNNRDKRKHVIFHSDGGGQYYDKRILHLLKSENIERSMANVCYDNSHAERINGTIKNYYIRHWNPSSFEELKKYTTLACTKYNVRPHDSLKGNSPIEFEDKWQKVSTYPHSHINNNYNMFKL